MKKLILISLLIQSTFAFSQSANQELSSCEERVYRENKEKYRRHQNRRFGGISGTTSNGGSFYIPYNAFNNRPEIGPYVDKRQTILNFANKDPIYFSDEERKLFTRYLDRARKELNNREFSAEKFQKYIKLGFKKNDFCSGFRLFGDNDRIVSKQKALKIALGYIKNNETISQVAIHDDQRNPTSMNVGDDLNSTESESNASEQ